MSHVTHLPEDKRTLNDVQEYKFEDEINLIAEQFPDTSVEAKTSLSTDMSSSYRISSDIRRALVGRYPLCLKLRDDYENWSGRYCERTGEHLPTYIDSAGMLNEPCVIAAAIAIRPFQYWEWQLVDAWSWVYRHACLMNVSIDQFEKWCEFRDPNISREFLMTQLTWFYRPSALPVPAAPSEPDLANSDV